MAMPYLEHLLFGVAITSTSIHLLWHKREAQEQRRHYATRIALLEDTTRRLCAGEHVPESDFSMIKKLAAEPGAAEAAARGVEPDGDIGWRDVILGRKVAKNGPQDSNKWDEIDLEKLKKELQSSS